MSPDVPVPGSIDRQHYDLYRVESNDFIAAVLVDWNSGEIREASPMLRYLVRAHVGELLKRGERSGWNIRLIPHVGNENAPGLHVAAQALVRIVGSAGRRGADPARARRRPASDGAPWRPLHPLRRRRVHGAAAQGRWLDAANPRQPRGHLRVRRVDLWQ